MLTIRLFRVGRKNQPAFKIVVTDKRNPTARGRFVEEVGFYNPRTKQRNLKRDRVKYWMSVGAKPSDTIYNMLIAEKVLEGAKIPKHKPPQKPAEPAAAGQTILPTSPAAPETPEIAPEALQKADFPVEEKKEPRKA